MNRPTKLTAIVLASTLLLAGCAATGTAESVMSVQSSDASTTTTTEAAASTEWSDTSADIDWSALPTTDVTLTDEGLAITEAGTYVLTGTSTGQVTVNTDGNVRIILNGVTIDSTVGAAIQVDNAELTVIELASGTSNSLSDASTRSDEEIDGVVYSADDLFLTGDGSLTVTANFADGIVGKDDLSILSGTISVTSVDDGIRGTDSLTVVGGQITIDAAGDGMKSTNTTDVGEGRLTVTGGQITIATGDDGIKAEQAISITGGTIDVTESVEGIEAPVIVIEGGDISVAASDDGINAAVSDIITSGLSITISRGTIDITMGSGDTDAIDSNGDVTISGGTITITGQSGQSGVDFDGTGTLTGGTVTVNGTQVTELTGQMMGGGGGGGGRP